MLATLLGLVEGCWQFYASADMPYPGLVVGTGVEDYFDSSYYFGADSGIFGGNHQHWIRISWGVGSLGVLCFTGCT